MHFKASFNNGPTFVILHKYSVWSFVLESKLVATQRRMSAFLLFKSLKN